MVCLGILNIYTPCYRLYILWVSLVEVANHVFLTTLRSLLRLSRPLNLVEQLVQFRKRLRVNTGIVSFESWWCGCDLLGQSWLPLWEHCSMECSSSPTNIPSLVSLILTSPPAAGIGASLAWTNGSSKLTTAKTEDGPGFLAVSPVMTTFPAVPTYSSHSWTSLLLALCVGVSDRNWLVSHVWMCLSSLVQPCIYRIKIFTFLPFVLRRSAIDLMYIPLSSRFYISCFKMCLKTSVCRVNPVI